ncbi:MAG TPA: response regulator, partial [Opitutaceae bacterium]|nr:response regulator [Opitutaceae bacterium]
IHGQEVSLVITDVNMPGLDGAALAKVVQHMNPKAKVMMMTGMSGAELNARPNRFDGSILSKPFTIPTLLAMVASELGAEKEMPEASV